MTPGERINALGMDKQQRIWVEVIYHTICGAEYSAPNGSMNNTAEMDFPTCFSPAAEALRTLCISVRAFPARAV